MEDGGSGTLAAREGALVDGFLFFKQGFDHLL